MPPKRSSDLARAMTFCQLQAEAHQEATSCWRDEGVWRYALKGWPCRGTLCGTAEVISVERRAGERRALPSERPPRPDRRDERRVGVRVPAVRRIKESR